MKNPTRPPNKKNKKTKPTALRDPELCDRLRAAGHALNMVGPYDGDVTGHAGSLVLHPDGLIEGATDPRSDGAVAAY